MSMVFFYSELIPDPFLNVDYMYLEGQSERFFFTSKRISRKNLHKKHNFYHESKVKYFKPIGNYM